MDQRRVAAQGRRRNAGLRIGHEVAERQHPVNRLAERDDLPGSVGGHVNAGRKLGLLARVANHRPRAAADQPECDRWRREGSEQRHLHRPKPPDTHQRDEKGAALAHQRCNAVARADAKAFECGGKTLRIPAQFAIGDVLGREVSADDPVGQRGRIVPITKQPCGTCFRSRPYLKQFADALIYGASFRLGARISAARLRWK